jgi:hypothetical protein
LPPERQAEREGTKPSALAGGGDGEEFGRRRSREEMRQKTNRGTD